MYTQSMQAVCPPRNTPAIFVSPATFPPTERLTAPASYLPHAVRCDDECRTRTSVPFTALWGPGSCRGPRSRYLNPSARDRGVRRNSRRPQRGEGRGKIRRGQRRPNAPENQRQPLGVTKRQFSSVVGRLLDAFGKDASGVSALQHSRKIVSSATFRPCAVPLRCDPIPVMSAARRP